VILGESDRRRARDRVVVLVRSLFMSMIAHTIRKLFEHLIRPISKTRNLEGMAEIGYLEHRVIVVSTSLATVAVSHS
jgi:hypothetical protein